MTQPKVPEKDPKPTPRGPEDEPVGDEEKDEPPFEEPPPATPDANPIDPRVFGGAQKDSVVGNRDAHATRGGAGPSKK